MPREHVRPYVNRRESGFTAQGTLILEPGRFLRRKRDIVVSPPQRLVEMAQGDSQQLEGQRQIAQWQALDAILDTIKGYPSLSNGAVLESIMKVAPSVNGNVREEDLVMRNPMKGTYSPVAIAVAFYVAERREAGATVSYEDLGEIVAMVAEVSGARAKREFELLNGSGQEQ